MQTKNTNTFLFFETMYVKTIRYIP